MGQYCGVTSKSRRSSSAPISNYDDVSITESEDSDYIPGPLPGKGNKSNLNRSNTPNQRNMNSSNVLGGGYSSQRGMNGGFSGGYGGAFVQYWEPNISDVKQAIKFVEEVATTKASNLPLNLNSNPMLMIDNNYALFDKYNPNQMNRSNSFQESLSKNEKNFKSMKERYFDTTSRFDLTKLAEDPEYLSHFEPIPKMKTVEYPYSTARGNENNNLTSESRPISGKASQNSNNSPYTQSNNYNTNPSQYAGNNTTQTNVNARPSNRSDNTVNRELDKLPTKDFADSLSDISTRMDPAKPQANRPGQGITNGKMFDGSLDSSFNARGSEDEGLNTSMQSSHSSSVSVRDLSYQRVTEQRLLNLVRASPTKEPPKGAKGAKGSINDKKGSIKGTESVRVPTNVQQTGGKEIKKAPGANSTASTEKGKDSRIQYKHYWKEAGRHEIFVNLIERPSPGHKRKDLNESKDSHEFEMSHRSILELSKEMHSKPLANTHLNSNKYRYFSKKYDFEGNSILSRTGHNRGNESFASEQSFHLPKNILGNQNSNSKQNQLKSATNNVVQIQGFQKALNQSKSSNQDGSKSARLSGDHPAEEPFNQPKYFQNTKNNVATVAKNMMYAQKIVNEAQKHKAKSHNPYRPENSIEDQEEEEEEENEQVPLQRPSQKQIDPRLTNAAKKLVENHIPQRQANSNQRNMYNNPEPISEEEPEDQPPLIKQNSSKPDPRLSKAVQGLIQPQTQSQGQLKRANSNQQPLSKPEEESNSKSPKNTPAINPRLAQSVQQAINVPSLQRKYNSVPVQNLGQSGQSKPNNKPNQIIEEDEEVESPPSKPASIKAKVDQRLTKGIQELLKPPSAQSNNNRPSQQPKSNILVQNSTSSGEESDVQSPQVQTRSLSPANSRLQGSAKNVLQAQNLQKAIAQKKDQRNSSNGPSGAPARKSKMLISDDEDTSNGGYSSADAEIDLTAYVKGGAPQSTRENRQAIAQKGREISSSPDDKVTNPKLQRSKTDQNPSKAKENPFTRGNTISTTPMDIKRQTTSKFGAEEEGPNFGPNRTSSQNQNQGQPAPNQIQRIPSVKKQPTFGETESPTREPRLTRVESFGKPLPIVEEVPVKEIVLRKSNTPTNNTNNPGAPGAQKVLASSTSPIRKTIDQMLVPPSMNEEAKEKARQEKAAIKKNMTFEQKLMPPKMLGIDSEEEVNDEEFIHKIGGELRKLSEKMVTTAAINSFKKGLANSNPQKLIQAIKKK